MAYNTTALENSTDVYEAVKEINVLGDGFFVVFILLIIFLITLAITRNQDGAVQFLAASFICGVASAIFFALEMTELTTVIVCVVLLIISIIIMIWKR